MENVEKFWRGFGQERVHKDGEKTRPVTQPLEVASSLLSTTTPVIENKFKGLPVVSVHLDVDMMLMSEKPIKTAREAIEFVAGKIYDGAEETAVAIFYDDALLPLCVATVGGGGTTRNVMFSPRDVVQTALLCNASYVTLIHNHPGLSSEKSKCFPSKEDISMTDAMVDACNTVGVKVYDSIVVSSFRENRGSKLEPIYYSIAQHNFNKILKKAGPLYEKKRVNDESKLSFERGKENNTRGGRVPDTTVETKGIRYYGAVKE